MRAEKCRMSWGLAKSLDQAARAKPNISHHCTLTSDLCQRTKIPIAASKFAKWIFFLGFRQKIAKLCIVVNRHVAATIGYYEVFCNFEQSVPSFTITMKPEALR